MASVGVYKIIGVGPGPRQVTHTRTGSPPESWLCEWGKKRRCEFVVRYFPSRKGWRVLDIRKAMAFTLGGIGAVKWVGQVRGRYFETEDAAVMMALHMGATQPEQH